jgi:hypothetical protein
MRVAKLHERYYILVALYAAVFAPVPGFLLALSMQHEWSASDEHFGASARCPSM